MQNLEGPYFCIPNYHFCFLNSYFSILTSTFWIPPARILCTAAPGAADTWESLHPSVSVGTDRNSNRGRR